MGCWNGTCGITSLPIKWGEKVYALLLVDTGSFPNVRYYADDNAVMLGFPFKGEYDDYGCLENIEIKDYVWDFILKQNYIIKDNKGNEKEFVPEDMEQLIREIETLYVISKQREIVPKDDSYEFQFIEKKCALSIMFIHEEVYNIIVNSIYDRIPYEGKEKYGTLLKEKVLKKMDGIKEHIERERYLNEVLKEAGKEERELTSLLCNLEDALHISYNNVSYYAPSIIKEIGLSDFEENKDEYAEDITRYICLLMGLNLSRKGFYCVTGLGSQSEEYLIHKKIAEWTIRKCESVVTKYKEVNPEEEVSDEEILAETLF